jgi:hypothetical protein
MHLDQLSSVIALSEGRASSNRVRGSKTISFVDDRIVRPRGR